MRGKEIGAYRVTVNTVFFRLISTIGFLPSFPPPTISDLASIRVNNIAAHEDAVRSKRPAMRRNENLARIRETNICNRSEKVKLRHILHQRNKLEK